MAPPIPEQEPAARVGRVYPGIESASGPATGREAVAVDISNILEAGRAGVNYLLIWEMEGNAEGPVRPPAKAYGPIRPRVDGGRPTALYAALVELAKVFPPGTTLYRSTVKGPVTALAGAKGIVLVSQSSHDLTVTVNGRKTFLGPYAITVTH